MVRHRVLVALLSDRPDLIRPTRPDFAREASADPDRLVDYGRTDQLHRVPAIVDPTDLLLP